MPRAHRSSRRYGVPIGALAACLVLACGGEEPVTIRLMTYNIGNPNAADPHYPLRLKHQRYEDHIRDQIRARALDVVFLQEVLPPTHCEGFVETDPDRTCWDAVNREPQARRILGPGHTIVCDSRHHLECIGVRTSFGTIAGVAPGAFLLDGAETSPLPLEACDWAQECRDDQCDATASVSAVSVETPHGKLRLVHVHLMAPGRSASGIFWGAACRARQLQQAFESLTGPDATVVAGDFNLDPVRLIGGAEAAIWSRHVGEGHRFRDLTPCAKSGTQYGTRRGNFGIAVDHVLADRASGGCTVHGHSIGVDPGTEPLDAGFDGDHGSRIDHFAITCELRLDLAAPPAKGGSGLAPGAYAGGFAAPWPSAR